MKLWQLGFYRISLEHYEVRAVGKCLVLEVCIKVIYNNDIQD